MDAHNQEPSERSSAVRLRSKGPFDLAVSVAAAQSFGRPAAGGRPPAPTVRAAGAAAAGAPAPGAATFPSTPEPTELRLGVRLDGRPTVLEVVQVARRPPILEATARPCSDPASLTRLTARVINAGLDLRPFYRVAAGHPVLGRLTTILFGLKPFRPPSLFQMLVIAVTEQQISLAAAQQITARLVERFGSSMEGLPIFPAPRRLAVASLEELTACGLSRRKAEYISGIAAQVADGGLDLEKLESASDDDVRGRLSAIRGLGRWSADYVLIRGLARPDVVPADDLGIRTIVGRTLGAGPRLTAPEVEEALAPLAPYRGIAVFYLLVGSRMGLLAGRAGPTEKPSGGG